MKTISSLFYPSQAKITEGLHARSSGERMVGLLKHASLSDREAMLISSCKQVHTFFMKFSIDAIFIGRDGTVVGVEELKPWRLSKIHWRAHSVIETRIGWAKSHGIIVGSKAEVTPC